MNNIQLLGFTLHWQDRTSTSGKARDGALCIFENNSWCKKSYSKEVSRFCSPDVKYLIIICRPHYLRREFSSTFFVAIYLPPQTDACTKTALNKLNMAMSKQENAHPETALLVAGDLNLFYLTSTSNINVQPEGKKTLDHLYFTHRHIFKALPYHHLANLTITLPS